MTDSDSKQKLYFNGLNADGGYLFEPMDADELAELAHRQLTGRQVREQAHLKELQWRAKWQREANLGVKEGIHPGNLDQTGWGVIFPTVQPGSAEDVEQQQIVEALKPLLDWRREQATKKSERYFQIFRHERGYCPGDSKQKFLANLGIGPGPADPARGVPYYLLIVASPAVLPFHVQYQLDVQYAVGRIHFDSLAEYASYAASVVAAEKRELKLPQEVAFFGVANPDDPATQLSRQLLVAPLADLLAQQPASAPWQLKRYFDEAASRQTLEQLLGRGETAPALLFTASHGMGLHSGDPRQQRRQGALVCQDWPGPFRGSRPMSESCYFSADHLPSDANLLGLIAFNFACFGAGTPQRDEFSPRSAEAPQELAPTAFVSGLHKKMLGLEKGGALATIGHVERAWGWSFMWGSGAQKAAQLTVFESALTALLAGLPVGAALECFNQRYAELSSDLTLYLEESEFSGGADPRRLADMWTSNNDARGYVINGDPAVRLRANVQPATSSIEGREPRGNAER